MPQSGAFDGQIENLFCALRFRFVTQETNPRKSVMARFTLHLEVAEPYQASTRALDTARKMGFELVRMRLDRIAAKRHRIDLGLHARNVDPSWWDCLFHRLEGTPGIGKVSWGRRRATLDEA